MIVFDTETTGLVKNESLPLDKQPKIIEFGAIKVDSDLKEIDRIEFLVNPGEKLEPIITKITGIKDSDLKDESPFVEYYGALCNFFLGEDTMAAHNLPFDRSLLLFELQRIGKQYQFPWPSYHICTVERTTSITGKYMKLEALYQHYFKEDPKQTHRAIEDVELLLKVMRKMKEDGFLL